jgi:hypothetical protein
MKTKPNVPSKNSLTSVSCLKIMNSESTGTKTKKRKLSVKTLNSIGILKATKKQSVPADVPKKRPIIIYFMKLRNFDKPKIHKTVAETLSNLFFLCIGYFLKGFIAVFASLT